MLAMVLENREVGGASAYELFKDRCAGDEILSADLKRGIYPVKEYPFSISTRKRM
jgi:hypothetical protein